MKQTAQRWSLGIAAAALLLGLLWAFVTTRSGDTPAEVLPAPPPPSTWSAQALAEPIPASGTQTLGGQVLGPEGPVAGALVVALPAPSAAWRSLSLAPGRWEETCAWNPAAARLLEQVDAHRGDAVPLARSTTDAQGRFRLEGLGAEPFVLWAEKGVLLGVHEALSAGAREARVSVRPGEWLSSEVLDETGAPVAGVRVTTWVRAAGRAVETLTGEDGRFVLGPVPDRREPLVVSKPGWLTASYDLREAARARLGLSRPHRLVGRVLEERGPVAGATVQLENVPTLDAVSTDAQGRFGLEGLCMGRHVLVAQRAGHLARRWVDVTSGQDGPPVDLWLTPSVRVSGRVTGPSGEVLAEAEVSTTGEGAPPQRLSTKTDARGRFVLEPLFPGLHAVRAQAPHHVPTRLFPRLFDTSQELDLVLMRAELLEGVVVDERDVPVKEVRLQLLRERRSDPEQSPVTSDADGRFVLDALRPGTWRVVARHPDFPSTEVTLAAPARDVRVVMRRGAPLEVQVASADGRPVEGAEVVLRTAPSETRPLSGRTDADGKAVFGPLKSGDYTVQACSAEGHQTSALTLTAAESRTVRVSLPRAGRLTGQVVDAQGRPVTGASLKLSPDAPRPRACRASIELQSGDAGRFSQALSEGTWTLSASARDRVHPPLQVRISADESQVRLVLRAPEYLLRGRVVREDGRPVTAFQLNGREVQHPEGRFTLPRVREETLTLEAPGLTPFTQDMSKASREEDLDLGEVVLQPRMRVEGRVVDALSAAPIAGTLVGIQGRPPIPSRLSEVTYTGPEGHFTLEGVRPTDKSLRIVHPLYPALDVAFTPGRPVEVRLEPGATLEGRVESDGVPVERGTVQLRTPEGAIATSTEVGQGRYTLGQLRAGPYTVRVQGARSEGPALLFPMRTVELVAGERTALDFADRATGVSLEVGVPERNIDVYLIPGDLPLRSPREGLYNTLADATLGKRVSDTVRRFPPLPGGAYTLVAIRADESTDVHREQVELPAEGEFSVTLAPVWNTYAD